MTELDLRELVQRKVLAALAGLDPEAVESAVWIVGDLVYDGFGTRIGHVRQRGWERCTCEPLAQTEEHGNVTVVWAAEFGSYRRTLGAKDSDQLLK